MALEGRRRRFACINTQYTIAGEHTLRDSLLEVVLHFIFHGKHKQRSRRVLPALVHI